MQEIKWISAKEQLLAEVARLIKEVSDHDQG